MRYGLLLALLLALTGCGVRPYSQSAHDPDFVPTRALPMIYIHPPQYPGGPTSTEFVP